MPHVFALEGVDVSTLGALADSSPSGVTTSGSNVAVVSYPPWGVPLAPSGAPIGPARIETPVFGPGGTPVPPYQRFPARGPICNYCEPDPTAAYITGGFGDAASAFKDHPVMGAVATLGGALILGGLVGGAVIWLLGKKS